MTMALHQMQTKAKRLERTFAPLLAFVWKIGDDAVASNAGMLAYNLLIAVVPLLVGLLALIGWAYFLNGHTEEALTQLITTRVQHTLPGNVVEDTVHAIKQQSAALGVIGLVLSLFAGASFFQNVDYVLSIIYRVKQRDLAREWLMSLGMVLLLIPLILVMILATSVPQLLTTFLLFSGSAWPRAPFYGAVIWVVAFLGGVLAAFALFSAIYIIVPNQWVPFKNVRWGALIAALLLEVYTLLFPFYVSLIVHPNRLGASMGFVAVILVFFYYFAFILLLGAEINSWLLGKRDLHGSMPEILHRLEHRKDLTGDKDTSATTPSLQASTTQRPEADAPKTTATEAHMSSPAPAQPRASKPAERRSADDTTASAQRTPTLHVLVLGMLAAAAFVGEWFGRRNGRRRGPAGG